MLEGNMTSVKEVLVAASFVPVLAVKIKTHPPDVSTWLKYLARSAFQTL